MRLDAELARRVMATMNAPGQGYRSLDEFVSVAVLNQLNTEMSVGDTVAAGPDRLELWRVHSLLARPAGDGAATGTVDALAVSDGLFILTNRLSPLKVATRVLANLRGLVDRLPGGRGWPTLKTLQTTAGHAARALGFELRRLDRLRTATHRDRRWTGYPVGRDERASLDRFTVSFTLTATSTAVSGPLVVLGLAATTKGGRVALTRAGERLAAAPSPLLDGFGAGTLSEEERVLLTGQIGRAPGERAAVVEFLELVGLADGSQEELDGGLGRRHAGWSRNRTTAHRAALVGRLCELGLLEAQGRGTSARLRPLPSAEQFLEECGSRRT